MIVYNFCFCLFLCFFFWVNFSLCLFFVLVLFAWVFFFFLSLFFSLFVFLFRCSLSFLGFVCVFTFIETVYHVRVLILIAMNLKIPHKKKHSKFLSNPSRMERLVEYIFNIPSYPMGRRGRDRIVVGLLPIQSVPITTNAVSSNPTQAIQHYVIKVVNGLRQVGGFRGVLRFPPPIKLTSRI